MKIPILLISGYLGAGKTTLLQHILYYTDKKIAILMNEFGEIGIDTQTIKKQNIAVKELLEGCVCCSLAGELEAALREIISLYKPEMIVIETTGIAEADNLVVEIDQELDFVTLDAVVTVVDADVMQRFPETKGSAEIQIKVADLLLLNKVDLVSGTEEITQRLRQINQRAPIVETTYCKVDLNLLIAVEADHHHLQKSEHHHHMQTFSIPTKETSKKDFVEFLKSLPREVFRLKGHITLDGVSYLVNYVADRWHLEERNAEQKLIFIGEQVKDVQQGIAEALRTIYNNRQIF